jgi:hypothetical protein
LAYCSGEVGVVAGVVAPVVWASAGLAIAVAATENNKS